MNGTHWCWFCHMCVSLLNLALSLSWSRSSSATKEHLSTRTSTYASSLTLAKYFHHFTSPLFLWIYTILQLVLVIYPQNVFFLKTRGRILCRLTNDWWTLSVSIHYVPSIFTKDINRSLKRCKINRSSLMYKMN